MTSTWSKSSKPAKSPAYY